MLAACASVAQAFGFEPITQDYDTSGPGASHVFRVVNSSDARIAVRVSVVPRRIELDGTEIQGKESDDFIVYPRQLLLDPGEQRSVRVRWAGPESINAELPYRIIAEQVPVNLGAETQTQGATIRLTYRYEGSLYVVPVGAQPSVSVVSAASEETSDGRVLHVRLANSGTRHVILNGATLTLREQPNGDPQIVLDAERLAGLAGENMLAESQRDFTVPAPEILWSGPVYARIELGAE